MPEIKFLLVFIYIGSSVINYPVKKRLGGPGFLKDTLVASFDQFVLLSLILFLLENSLVVLMAAEGDIKIEKLLQEGCCSNF